MQALSAKLDNQRFPSSEQGLQALVSKPASAPVPGNWRPYLDKLPADPLGQPLPVPESGPARPGRRAVAGRRRPARRRGPRRRHRQLAVSASHADAPARLHAARTAGRWPSGLATAGVSLSLPDANPLERDAQRLAALLSRHARRRAPPARCCNGARPRGLSSAAATARHRQRRHAGPRDWLAEACRRRSNAGGRHHAPARSGARHCGPDTATAAG